MIKPTSFVLFVAIVSFASAWGARPEHPPLDAAAAQADLDKIPPTDPDVPNAPALVAAMKNVHPRLLFTTAEIQALKASIPTDPVMQTAYDGVKQWAKLSVVPSGPRPPIIADDTSAIVKSFTQAPAMAYAYALDHDPAIKEKIVQTLTEMVSLPYWADGKELDSEMGGACNMLMVSLLYDTVYHDLDPALRQSLAAKIFTQARRMYYLGHKELCNNMIKYWQNDPQNNHRWYNDMGLAACVLAVCDEPNIHAGYLLQGLKNEMDFVMKWYPPDGNCHEGAGYQSFGYTPIVTACEIMDRNLGTHYLETSGLRNAWKQYMYLWVPGRRSDMSWADDQNAPGTTIDGTFFIGPHLDRDPLAQAALLLRLNHSLTGKNGKPVIPGWTLFAFYDPSLKAGEAGQLPTCQLLADMGSASLRDSWKDNAVVFTFKCGPYGGYALNNFRNTTLENGQRHYVNVAHDDPDANEFALTVGDGFAFHPGNYTSPDHSRRFSAQHSTLTVDGKGQVGEDESFTQPVGGYDMTQFSFLTGWKTDPAGHAIVEGEAGNAYHDMTEPDLVANHGKLAPAMLKTYRRTAIWMPKDYILILDNIATNGGARAITWHGSSVQAQMANGRGFITSEKGDRINVQTVSDQKFTTAVEPMVLVGRFGNDPIQQIQFTAQTSAIKFATLLDPWKTNPEVKMTESGGVATVTVHAAKFTDTWSWHEAKNDETPSVITGMRAGAPLISLTESDQAPRK